MAAILINDLHNFYLGKHGPLGDINNNNNVDQ